MNSTIVLGDLHLADPSDIVADWTPALVREVQEVPLARARNGRAIDRGNVRVTYTFTVSRGHETLIAAEDYLTDLPRLVGRAFGAFSATRPLTGRVIELVEASATFQAQPQIGLRTIVTFTVTGSLPPDIT